MQSSTHSNSLYACDLVTPQQLEQADAKLGDYPALMPFELMQAIKNKPGKMAGLSRAGTTATIPIRAPPTRALKCLRQTIQ